MALWSRQNFPASTLLFLFIQFFLTSKYLCLFIFTLTNSLALCHYKPTQFPQAELFILLSQEVLERCDPTKTKKSTFRVIA